MAIYLCRWPNGEFSIVSAKTKGAAIELLDEWGDAEQAFLLRMTDCMLDFRLGGDGQIELANIGESTMTASWKPAIRNSTRPWPQPSGMRRGQTTRRKGTSKSGKQLSWSGRDYGIAAASKGS